MSDILERLGLPCNPADPDADVKLPFWTFELLCDAHEEITRLRAELERARGALRPFAEIAEHDILETDADNDRFLPMHQYNVGPKCTVGLFRRARAALKENSHE